MTKGIKEAKDLNENNKEILIAFLHFLHMTEHLQRQRRWDWAYRNIQAHWAGAYPRHHWVGR